MRHGGSGCDIMLCGSAVWTMVWFYNRHKTNERNQRMEAELVQLKFNFFTNITHELRTPLSLIITPLDALIRRSDNADTRKQLINIRRNAGELLKLINRTLSSDVWRWAESDCRSRKAIWPNLSVI